MKGKHCIFLLFILVALMSCNDPKPITDTLHRAESLMNESPDYAWTLLNTISPDEMGQNRNRALYALLYTQAQDKTYRDETNDSLINIAVDYYRDTDDVRHKFLSYYYKGRVHFNIKDYLSATTCYMEAEQLASEVGDDYLVGLLYAELGRIYNIYYDYPKSLGAYQKAAECYERAGKIRHRNYMWLNQSDVCRNMGQNAESKRLLQMALLSAQKERDSTLIKSCMGSLVMMYIEEKRMQEALELYETLESVAGINYGSASFMGKLAQMYASKDEYVEALALLERGWACAEERMDSVNLYISSSSLLAKQGKNDLAYQELLKGVTLQNKEAKQTLQQPVLTVQRDHLSDKLEFEAYRLRIEKRLNLLYILFSVLILIAVVYGFIKILKKNKKIAQQTISELEQKRKETEKKKEQVEKDRRKLEEENRKISFLLQKMDRDKKVADQTINDLKNEIAKQEKETNETMSGLIQKLEDENKMNVETIGRLRESLDYQETVYQQYELKNEKIQKDLQEVIDIKSEHISVLLKDWLEFMSEWILLYEEQLTLKNYKEKKIKRTIEDTRTKYFKGKDAFRNLERLVNLYHDNAMQYFREEIQLTDEKDYFRVCCLFAGIPSHVIAWVMDEKTDVVYQRKSRLRKKISSMSCFHQTLFLKLLPK